MQEMINQISDGDFEYEGRSLDFSCEKIELSLPVNTDYEGSFRIVSPTGRFTTGHITASDVRMECLTAEFSGCDEEVSYCFHGNGLEEGDRIRGSFFIVSSQGEYELPFTVAVACSVPASSMGEIRNLFHFANLARSNWQEAVRLFYLPEFLHIFEGSDKRFLDVYRGLSACPGNEQNVEEFLIHTNKKQRMEYTTEEDEILIELQGGGDSHPIYEKTVSIVRNGWGYARLFVECRGDFLFTEKEVLTDDDFLGSRCDLPVFVDGSLCKRGRSFGKIYLYNSYVSLELPVTVRVADTGMYGAAMDDSGLPFSASQSFAARRARLSVKRLAVQMMEYYTAFRLRQISSKTWLQETGRLVERMVAADEKNAAPRLFQAQLYLTRERYHEAEWLLSHAADLMSEEEREGTLQAYYLYLTTLLNPEEAYVNHTAIRVKQIFKRDTQNWRVAWLMLFLSEELNRSQAKKWAFLEKQFQYGCKSPVLYLEALALLNANPSLLRRLNAFEMQVLFFGARKKALELEAVEQLLYLANKAREFSPVLLKTLQLLYEKQKDVRLLQEICALLIKGGRTGRESFSWYKAGVEAQLRITNLYEYFMASLDLDSSQPLPKAALLYFSYRNNLDYERSAYLYDYVVRHKEELPELYGVYRGRVEYFVEERLKKGQVNRHLAFLYREFLTQNMINPQTGEALARILFSYRIRVEDSRIRTVYVYQPDNLSPVSYTLSEGKACISLYGSEYTIVLEDGFQNRFTKNAAYMLEELMEPEAFVDWIVPYVRSCPGLDLYLYEKDRTGRESPGETAARYLRLAESKWAASRVKRSCYPKILQYYYDADNMRGLDEYLVRIPAGELQKKERGEVLKYMVLRGLYAPAYRLLEKYGSDFARPGLLVQLLGPLMERNRMVEDPVLTGAATAAFRAGKYDGVILTYLTMYFRGLIGDMRDIWKAARAYDVDCYRLSERMLVQMLYTGAFAEESMEIFRYYLSQGPKAKVEEIFLSRYAYRYLIYDEEPEETVFREIKNMYLRAEEVQKVCRVALLKYYGEGREQSEEIAPVIKAFLEEMAAEGLHLDFLRGYTECETLQLDMLDKTIVEYRAHPGSRVSIHYAMLSESTETLQQSEYMREVCCGLYFAEFVLFSGESLSYSVIEEREGGQTKTVSGILHRRDGAEGQDGRYQLINDIVISKSLEDEEKLEGLLEEYYGREYYNGRLFALK